MAPLGLLVALSVANAKAPWTLGAPPASMPAPVAAAPPEPDIHRTLEAEPLDSMATAAFTRAYDHAGKPTIGVLVSAPSDQPFERSSVVVVGPDGIPRTVTEAPSLPGIPSGTDWRATVGATLQADLVGLEVRVVDLGVATWSGQGSAPSKYILESTWVTEGQLPALQLRCVDSSNGEVIAVATDVLPSSEPQVLASVTHRVLMQVLQALADRW